MFGHGDQVEDQVEHAGLALLYSVAGAQLAAGVPVMAESNFDSETDLEPLRGLQEKHGARLVQVHFSHSKEKLLERFVGRIEEGDRHPGHGDEPEDVHEVERKLDAGVWDPLDLPGELIRVDKDGPSFSVEALAARIRDPGDGYRGAVKRVALALALVVLLAPAGGQAGGTRISVAATSPLAKVLRRYDAKPAYSSPRAQLAPDPARVEADVFVSGSGDARSLFRARLVERPRLLASDRLVIIVPRANPAGIARYTTSTSRRRSWSSPGRTCPRARPRVRCSGGSASRSSSRMPSASSRRRSASSPRWLQGRRTRASYTPRTRGPPAHVCARSRSRRTPSRQCHTRSPCSAPARARPQHVPGSSASRAAREAGLPPGRIPVTGSVPRRCLGDPRSRPTGEHREGAAHVHGGGACARRECRHAQALGSRRPHPYAA